MSQSSPRKRRCINIDGDNFPTAIRQLAREAAFATTDIQCTTAVWRNCAKDEIVIVDVAIPGIPLH